MHGANMKIFVQCYADFTSWLLQQIWLFPCPRGFCNPVRIYGMKINDMVWIWRNISTWIIQRIIYIYIFCCVSEGLVHKNSTCYDKRLNASGSMHWACQCTACCSVQVLQLERGTQWKQRWLSASETAGNTNYDYTCNDLYTLVCTCVHWYTLVHTRAHLYTLVCTYAHSYTLCTLVQTCAHSCTLVHTCVHLYTLAHACTHFCALVRTCTHLCALVHTCIHLCTLVHTCVHLCIRTQITSKQQS